VNYPQLALAERITIHEREVVLNQLPPPLRVDEDLGILTSLQVRGEVVYRAERSWRIIRSGKGPAEPRQPLECGGVSSCQRYAAEPSFQTA
jgi:hypothetical protein